MGFDAEQELLIQQKMEELRRAFSSYKCVGGAWQPAEVPVG